MKEKQEIERKECALRDPEGPQARTEDLLVSRLRDLSHTMRALSEGRGSQRRVLVVLEEMGGTATQRALTDRLRIRSGSASEVIGKLESAGAVQRRVSEEDHRNVDVSLTERGRALAQEARQQWAARHEEMFSCLSLEERTSLLTLLDKVSADWAVRYPDAVQRGLCPPNGCGHHGHCGEPGYGEDRDSDHNCGRRREEE